MNSNVPKNQPNSQDIETMKLTFICKGKYARTDIPYLLLDENQSKLEFSEQTINFFTQRSQSDFNKYGWKLCSINQLNEKTEAFDYLNGWSTVKK